MLAAQAESSALSFLVALLSAESLRPPLILPVHGVVSCFTLSLSSFMRARVCLCVRACVQSEILAEHGEMGAEEAVTYLKTMAQEGRYLRVVWS